MASTLPPVKGAAFTFDICLVSQADTDVFKTSPTLAAGDITVSKDGGDFANITTLPTQIETSGVLPVALSATEMNADRVTVRFHDAAGDEWQDALVTVYTAAQTLDTTDGVADTISGIVGHTDYGNAKLVRATTPANTLDIDASGGVDIRGTKNTLDSQYTALKKLIMLLARKDAAAAADLAAELAELNADLGSGAGAYASTTDSLEALQANVAAIVAAGTGTGTYTDTVTDGANPLDGVRVTLYSDAGMTSAKYQTFTNASGVFTMYPDPGTYYRKLELAGYTFTQGTAVTVT